MMNVGIEAINAYCGVAQLDLKELAVARELEPTRFEKLMMLHKTVAMPYEDPVSCAVNAAKPIIDGLSEDEKQQIEMLILCTESAIDFSKSMSTYVQDYLGLSRNCRLFEITHGCYAGTAGLQMGASFVLSQASPGAKVLVIATDLSRMMTTEGGELGEDWPYVEPSNGSGAVAMLISDQPHVFDLDVGASGYYGYEIMDYARPVPHADYANSDMSLLSYLDCCEHAYRHYESRVDGADYRETFDYLVFHTPFPGMVKGAHRTMMRRFKRAKAKPISADFDQRVEPGLRYCQQVGNLMGGALYLGLVSLIDNADISEPRRLGMFSYGSGCCSEFFSGVVTPEGKRRVTAGGLGDQLAQRYPLSIEQYEQLFSVNRSVAFGTRDTQLDFTLVPEIWDKIEGSGLLMLRSINNYHRVYEWV